MTETLLMRAYSNFNLALKLYSNLGQDKFELSILGYLLQQVTELSIKHVMEMTGIKKEYVHDIGVLITLLREDTKFLFKPIKLCSGTITNWESKTRYIEYSVLEEMIPIIKDILEKVSEWDREYKPNPIEQLKIQL